MKHVFTDKQMHMLNIEHCQLGNDLRERDTDKAMATMKRILNVLSSGKSSPIHSDDKNILHFDFSHKLPHELH